MHSYMILHRSGLDFGDQILNVNGMDVAGMGPAAVQSLLDHGTKVCVYVCVYVVSVDVCVCVHMRVWMGGRAGGWVDEWVCGLNVPCDCLRTWA